jgi:alcohol dehydrogenase class IV
MPQTRFYLPTEVVTGVGSFTGLGKSVAPLGRRALVVGSEGRRALLEEAAGLLTAAGVEATICAQAGPEPTLAIVEEIRAQARAAQAQVLVAIGGGSALDAGKATAGLFGQPGTVAEYHQGRVLGGEPGLPFVAVPTTSGTGAEVTKNAVLIDPGRGIKESIRADAWFARLAIVDPLLTVSLPPAATASTGADALCQAIESYVSIGAGPVSDPLAADAIERLGRSLERAVRQGDDVGARSDCAYGSLLAGMAMVNARLGAVHGLAHPLGARYGVAHGVLCGLLLPPVMAYNLQSATARYARIAALLGVNGRGLDAMGMARAGVERVRELLTAIGLPMRLRTVGVREADFNAIIADSLPQSSLKHNPRPMAAEDVRAVLEMAY